MTGQEIVKSVVSIGLRLDRENIPNSVRDLALDLINHHGRLIWDAWPWDESKIDIFKADDPNEDGIITFPEHVEIIRAIKTVIPSSGQQNPYPIFNADEVLSIHQSGDEVSVRNFVSLSPDNAGRTRIKVSKESNGNVERWVLALKKFEPFTLDNWLSTKWPIPKALPALVEYVIDSIKLHYGRDPSNRASGMLSNAIDRSANQPDREIRVVPRHPHFSEIGML